MPDRGHELSQVAPAMFVAPDRPVRPSQTTELFSSEIPRRDCLRGERTHPQAATSGARRTVSKKPFFRNHALQSSLRGPEFEAWGETGDAAAGTLPHGDQQA